MRIVFAVVFLAASWNAMERSYAQPADQKELIAQELFKEGLKFKEANQCPEAVSKFLESLSLSPGRLNPKLQLATCYRTMGKLLGAQELFREIQKQAEDQGDQQHVIFARQQLGALESEIPSLIIRSLTGENPDLITTLNGKVIPFASLNTPLPLDPGMSEFSAIVRGHKEFSRRIELRIGQSISIYIPISVIAQLNPVQGLPSGEPQILRTRPEEDLPEGELSFDGGPEPSAVQPRNRQNRNAWLIRSRYIALCLGALSFGVGKWSEDEAMRLSKDLDRRQWGPDIQERYAEGISHEQRMRTSYMIMTVSLVTAGTIWLTEILTE